MVNLRKTLPKTVLGSIVACFMAVFVMVESNSAEAASKVDFENIKKAWPEYKPGYVAGVLSQRKEMRRAVCHLSGSRRSGERSTPRQWTSSP